MRAIRLQAQGGAEQMRLDDAPQPVPNNGEVLIKVHATAVTPTELLWDLTWSTYAGEPRTLPILSHEFSGEVAELGEGVSDVAVGDEVYGLNDWTVNGALAQYMIATPAQLANKPNSIDYQQAAAIPMSALTAWQALVVRANISEGQRILIHGAAGGVGNMAVQIAHWRGAYVIATASVDNLDHVRASGADEVIDYRQSRFEEVAGDVDVIFDAVGGETLERSITMLKANAQLISIATESKETDYFFYVEPSHEQLGAIARLIDSGELHSVANEIFPLEKAREAYQSKPIRGKFVIAIDDI
ncbi:MAG: NADP-dependent oxidoreductase [bacterium]